MSTNLKIVHFAPSEADITKPSLPSLSFSSAARFLPDGRYVPAWLWDRIERHIETKQEAVNELPHASFNHDENAQYHYPQHQKDIIESNQKARDNLHGVTGRSSRPPTAPSHRDTRFPNTPNIDTDSRLGPGLYSLPPTFTANDGKNSAPFKNKSRSSLWNAAETVPFGAASHLLSSVEPRDLLKYLEKHGPHIRLDGKLPQRASIEDYRYSTRHSQSRKDLPPEPSSGTLQIDSAGRHTCLKDKALSNRLGSIPFESKSKKFDCNPVSASGQLGPGSHLPFTSIGGNGRRKSYRILMNAQPSSIGPSSPSFVATSRDGMHGPVSISTDSSLRKSF